MLGMGLGGRLSSPSILTVSLIALTAIGALGCGANGSSPGGYPSGASGSSGGTGSSGGPLPDAGARTDGGGLDASSGAADAGTDALPAAPTTVLFVHASPSLGSIRLCWMPGGSMLPAVPSSNEMPGSNYAGIPVGGAVSFTDPMNAPTLYGSLRLYALDAKLLAELGLQDTPCNRLICSGTNSCLAQNKQYWQVASFDPSALRPGTNLVAVGGCLATVLDAAANTSRCGSSWNAVQGNLHADVLPFGVAPTVEGGAPLFVQAAQLSSAVQSAGGANLTFGPENGVGMPVTQLVGESDLLPSVPLAIALLPGLGTFGTYGFALDWAAPSDDGSSADSGSSGYDGASAEGDATAPAARRHVWMSLAQSQELVSPAVDPTTYFAGGRYVVAVMGDPAAPLAFGAAADAGYDGTQLHLLVLPAATLPAAGANP